MAIEVNHAGARIAGLRLRAVDDINIVDDVRPCRFQELIGIKERRGLLVCISFGAKNSGLVGRVEQPSTSSNGDESLCIPFCCTVGTKRNYTQIFNYKNLANVGNSGKPF